MPILALRTTHCFVGCCHTPPWNSDSAMRNSIPYYVTSYITEYYQGRLCAAKHPFLKLLPV